MVYNCEMESERHLHLIDYTTMFDIIEKYQKYYPEMIFGISKENLTVNKLGIFNLMDLEIEVGDCVKIEVSNIDYPKGVEKGCAEDILEVIRTGGESPGIHVLKEEETLSSLERRLEGKNEVRS